MSRGRPCPEVITLSSVPRSCIAPRSFGYTRKHFRPPCCDGSPRRSIALGAHDHVTQGIARVAEEVAEFYELPTTGAGTAATFIAIFKLLLRLARCSPEIALESRRAVSKRVSGFYLRGCTRRNEGRGLPTLAVGNFNSTRRQPVRWN